MVTPAGVMETQRFPSSGAGPAPEHLFLGSEGALGVVTGAWLRLHVCPTFRARGHGGLRAVRRGGGGGGGPRPVRPSSPPTAGSSTRRRRRSPRPGTGQQHVLMIGFESADHPVAPWLARGSSCAATTKGLVVEQSSPRARRAVAGRAWRGRRLRGGNSGSPGRRRLAAELRRGAVPA